MTDHTCLGCGQCHPDAREVTLHDGRVVSSYSEDWREEAEAISILNLPNRGKRGNVVSMIRQRRGNVVADRLEKLVRTLWDKRREKIDDLRHQVDERVAAS